MPEWICSQCAYRPYPHSVSSAGARHCFTELQHFPHIPTTQPTGAKHKTVLSQPSIQQYTRQNCVPDSPLCTPHHTTAKRHKGCSWVIVLQLTAIWKAWTVQWGGPAGQMPAAVAAPRPCSSHPTPDTPATQRGVHRPAPQKHISCKKPYIHNNRTPLVAAPRPQPTSTTHTQPANQDSLARQHATHVCICTKLHTKGSRRRVPQQQSSNARCSKTKTKSPKETPSNWSVSQVWLHSVNPNSKSRSSP